MTRIRSPGYPSISLREAIAIVEKIYDRNRTNPIDREAAVRDMGYKGITGQSAKMLADLSHYDLVEKAGKGGIRVSDTAEKIIAPANDGEKDGALTSAAYSPGLFGEIKENWPDGFVSNNSLRNWLLRKGFGASAVPVAMKAYEETYGFLRQSLESESHGPKRENEAESLGDKQARAPAERRESAPPAVPPLKAGIEMMSGERVVFVEEGETSQYLKLVASGDIDAGMLEALEDFVKRQKRRLERVQPTTATDTAS